MTRINWGDPGSRIYEAGVDRGVLYIPGRMGVPWSGLVSVSESTTGGDNKEYFFDGYKYANLMSTEEYAGTIEAYYAPDEFALVEGYATISNGLMATNQRRKPFNFTYRTGLGSDASTEHGYKIHLIYNALAGKAARSYKTRDASVSLSPLSWDISAKPEKIPGLRPTAHLIVDSTQTTETKLAILEGYLYGAEGIDPVMPSVSDLIDLFED